MDLILTHCCQEYLVSTVVLFYYQLCLHMEVSTVEPVSRPVLHHQISPFPEFSEKCFFLMLLTNWTGVPCCLHIAQNLGTRLELSLLGVWHVGLAHMNIHVHYQDSLPPLCNVIIFFCISVFFCFSSIFKDLHLSFDMLYQYGNSLFFLHRCHIISQSSL